MKTTTRRIRFDRSDVNSAIAAAKRAVAGTEETRFVFATAYGFTIEKSLPFPFTRAIKVTSIGAVKIN